jgi:DNA-formamidopyrimidine glycosylase
MPEGPEVSIITDALQKYFKGKTLKEINIVPGGKYDKKSPDNYEFFIEQLPLTVNSIKNKGKLMYWSFDKNLYMLNHLNMTGKWSFKKEKHTTLEFKIGKEVIYYTDVRRFGRVEFLKNKEDLENKLDKLGPDMLRDKSLTEERFLDIIKKYRRRNITRVLMDQSIFSGIGNYLKSEILYASRVSPHLIVSQLDEKELKMLYQQSRKIITKSYQKGGVSKRDFKHVNDDDGQFQMMLEVYGKKTDRHGNNIRCEKTKDGRSTYWVPEIQENV